jgi:hypothetical protein
MAEGIGDAGVVPLVGAWQMGKCPRLRTLDLDSLYLTHVACNALAEAMRHEGLPLLEDLNHPVELDLGH